MSWLQRGAWLPLWCRRPSLRSCAFSAHGARAQTGVSLSSTQVQRRVARLNTLHRSLALPPLQHFVSEGTVYGLPMRARSVSLDTVPEKDLQYFVGFFDGDGCVQCTRRGEVRLCVGQSTARPEAVLFLHSTFGGRVHALGHGRGAAEPSIMWSATGKAASRLAQAMLRVPSVKRTQLELVASSGFSKASLVAVRDQLRQLKREPTLTPGACSWHYFAGFFDAEACVFVGAKSASLRVQINQKYAGALLSLRSFLKGELPSLPCRVKLYGGYHHMVLCGTAVCKELLSRLLEAGLKVKRHAAEFALTLTPSNHMDVRSKISALGGNQSRYKRLDEDGCRRAVEIARFRYRLSGRSLSDCERAQLKQHIADLKAEHELACLTQRLNLLRLDIRSLLRRGASRSTNRIAGRVGGELG